jgi:hypothetical protein
MSANMSVSTSTTQPKGQTDVVSSEPVDRKFKVLLTTLTMESFESNSDLAAHLANSIEAKREAEGAHKRAADGGRARKEQEKELTRKAKEKKNLKEKRVQEEEERLESEAEKARITQAEEERKQQLEDALKAEEGLEADDAVHTPSPANESQEPEDGEASQPGKFSSPPSSPLLTARVIENLNEVAYPEGIMGPKVELNANVRDGRFRFAVLPFSLRATYP